MSDQTGHIEAHVADDNQRLLKFSRDLHEQLTALEQTTADLNTIQQAIASAKSYVIRRDKTRPEVSGDLQEQVGNLDLAIVRLQEVQASMVGAKSSISTGEMPSKESRSSLGYVPRTIFRKYAYPWASPTTENLAVRQQFTAHFERIVATKYPVEARTAIEPYLIELRELVLVDSRIEYILRFEGRIGNLFEYFFNAPLWKSYGNYLHALFFEDEEVAAFLDENHVRPKYSFVNRAPIQ